MSLDHLASIDQKSRQAIINHPDIINYSPLNEKKEAFVPCFKIKQVHDTNCTRKQYLGYGFETAPLQLLHPILAIFVRLELTDLQLLHRITAAVEFHINRPSQSIQKIYDIKRLNYSQEPYTALLLKCELYSFTLKDLIAAIDEKRIKGFPKIFFQFFRAFLLQAYLNILDMLDRPSAAGLALSFSIHPENIMFDQFYRLMLGNPFFVQGAPSLLAFENDKQESFMHSGILKDFLNIFQHVLDLGQIREIMQKQKITHQAFDCKQQKFLKVKDQITLIQSLVKRNNIAFQFPNQELLQYFRKVQDILVKTLPAHPLAQYNLQRKERNRQLLRQRAQEYSQ